jgi:septal ring factor EnvC (AmiA/AmiB activator)
MDTNESKPPLSPKQTTKTKDELTATLVERKKIDDEIQQLEKQLHQRENALSPIYHQISVTFADLHDTPGRMLSKKVINDVIDWKSSRTFFYWRLRRLIAQDNIVKAILATAKTQQLTFNAALLVLKSWFDEANSSMFKKVENTF